MHKKRALNPHGPVNFFVSLHKKRALNPHGSVNIIISLHEKRALNSHGPLNFSISLHTMRALNPHGPVNTICNELAVPHIGMEEFAVFEVTLTSVVGTNSDPSDGTNVWISFIFPFASPVYPRYPQ
jgi:hypothetical protein